MRLLARARAPVVAALLAAFAGATAAAQATDAGWPRDITVDSGTITIYQPQLDSLHGIMLSARAAVAAIRKNGAAPVFGVIWFTARAQTDRDARQVAIDQLTVTNVRFPNITDEKSKRFTDLVNPVMAKWQFTISLDRFQAALAEASTLQRSADSLSTTPPKIVVSKVPAAILLFQGQPIFRELPNTPYQYAVNTPSFVVFDSTAKMYYLNGGPLWYSAQDPTGQWTNIKKPPEAIAKLVPDSIQKDSAPPGAPPKIVPATTPTELLVIDGDPQWVPVTGTDVLYVKNTDRAILKDLKDQRTFVLISGRFFAYWMSVPVTGSNLGSPS